MWRTFIVRGWGVNICCRSGQIHDVTSCSLAQHAWHTKVGCLALIAKPIAWIVEPSSLKLTNNVARSTLTRGGQNKPNSNKAPKADVCMISDDPKWPECSQLQNGARQGHAACGICSQHSSTKSPTTSKSTWNLSYRAEARLDTDTSCYRRSLGTSRCQRGSFKATKQHANKQGWTLLPESCISFCA